MCSMFESHWNRWSLKFLPTFDESVSLVFKERAYYVLPLSGIYLCFRIHATMPRDSALLNPVLITGGANTSMGSLDQ